jgi:hypothetical protein
MSAEVQLCVTCGERAKTNRLHCDECRRVWQADSSRANGTPPRPTRNFNGKSLQYKYISTPEFILGKTPIRTPHV